MRNQLSKADIIDLIKSFLKYRAYDYFSEAYTSQHLKLDTKNVAQYRNLVVGLIHNFPGGLIQKRPTEEVIRMWEARIAEEDIHIEVQKLANAEVQAPAGTQVRQDLESHEHIEPSN